MTVFTAVSTFHSHQASVHPALREGGGQVFILHGHLYSLGLVYQKECLSGAARSSSSPFVGALSLSLSVCMYIYIWRERERCVYVCVCVCVCV